MQGFYAVDFHVLSDQPFVCVYSRAMRSVSMLKT